MLRTGIRAVAVGVAVVVLAACDGAGPEGGGSGDARTAPSATAPAVVGCPRTPSDPGPHEYDAELRDELVAMLERDQEGRSGGVDEEGDAARTERLRQIIAEHGWPGFDLVGEDGEDAAWAIAQHSDLDPAFQRCALRHLRIAVGNGQGSPGNLAYLSDRIAVAAGEPQRYGTQVLCGRQGRPPRPQTPLAEPDRVEELRRQVDLEPYADYLAEMERICG